MSVTCPDCGESAGRGREIGHKSDCPSLLPDTQQGDATHEWFTPPTAKWEACRRCGIVRRADRKNRPCKGDVFVKLRQTSSIDLCERAVIDNLFAVYNQLKALGWREALYAPKDGSLIEVVTLGSTGIFKAAWQSYGHEPSDTCGCFFAEDGHDLYPTDIAVWRPIKN